jgi:hypothetical protein
MWPFVIADPKNKQFLNSFSQKPENLISDGVSLLKIKRSNG